uniref:Transmembrane protein n=1 Tax=Panagrolaimus davidi TaxID=227884 RepID=A0A914QAC5_9BILA
MENETYDPSNPKYRIACGCHVTTGTKIICWLYFLVYVLVVIQRAINFPHLPMIFVGIVIVPLSILIFSSGLYAVKKEKPIWLIPLLIALVCFNGSKEIRDL